MTQFGLFSEYGENNMYIINFKRPIGAMVKKNKCNWLCKNMTILKIEKWLRWYMFLPKLSIFFFFLFYYLYWDDIGYKIV